MKLFEVNSEIKIEGVAMTVSLSFHADSVLDAYTKAEELLGDIFKPQEIEYELFSVQEMEEETEE